MKIRPAFILLALSFLVHIVFFGQPKSVVFDETYNINFVSSYSTGEYYFDIHPPLAKLLVKWAGDAIGVDYYAIDAGAIGNPLPSTILFLRLIPILTGIFLPLVIYFICRRIKMSEIAAFIVGILLCLENSLIAQSRFILFDSLMLLFGFLSVLLYLIYSNTLASENEKLKDEPENKFSARNPNLILLASAIFSSLAFSIKWTGLAFPLLIIILSAINMNSMRKVLNLILIYGIVGFILYSGIFFTHFSYLNHSGPGNDFMSDRFQKTLVDNHYSQDLSIKSKGFFGKFLELNLEMYDANRTLMTNHEYSSSWYTWPIMMRPVFYWQSSELSYIYFLGNPLIYWLGSLSIIFLFIYLFKKGSDRRIPLFILIGFIVNFIPFAFIGRVMFLYHYESALIFSIMALAFLIDRARRKRTIFQILICACFVSFIFFSPLTYGLHLTDSQLATRMWLPTWR